jgi:hypothetical protein
MKPAASAVLAVLLLAGCAHGGKPMVVSRGEALAAGRTFALIEDGRPIGVAQTRVAAALGKAGLTAASADKADYLVTVAYTDRSSRIGVYQPAPDGKGEPLWLAEGQKPPKAWYRKGAASLALRVEDRASGKAVREVEAQGFYWRDGTKAPIRLADAAAAGLVQP